MNYLFNIIRSAFEWALFLALIGGLGETTMTMYKESGHARAHGLVNLTSLNRALGVR